LYLFSVLILCGFCLLLMRLWSMQINEYEEYRRKVPGTREERIRVPGVRGAIRDRNGIMLVGNRPSFEVTFDLRTIEKSFRETLSEGETVPLHTYQLMQGDFAVERSEVDIVEIVNRTVIASLEELGLAQPYNSAGLRIHYRSHKVIPWTYRRNLAFEEFAAFAERNLGLPGVRVTTRPVRHYPYGALASHVLGYVKLPDASAGTPEERAAWDFYIGDDVGIAGIERTRDKDLRGRPGTRTLLRDEKGKYVGQVGYQEPLPGADVFLTIDIRIQSFVERALREAGVGRGSVVVVSPSNGDVLAIASVPSFDPNKFIPQISKENYRDYITNPASPLINRALRGFAPGSTYKVAVALGGCLSGDESAYLNCPGRIRFGNIYMRCWAYSKGFSHGMVNLSDALKVSCNCYFYQYGNRSGISNIVEVGNMLGLGMPTGIEIPDEKGGILPSPRWLKLNHPREVWSDATTANVSIGQGYVLATPLQMAMVTATVANGGRCFRPRLVDRIIEGKGSSRDAVIKAIELRTDLATSGISSDQIEMIRRGMWEVVNGQRSSVGGGTGTRAHIEGIDVAGKTGTAQFWRRDPETGDKIKDNHAWFIAFAPYENPELAVAVMVRGGKGGGSCAAPVARRIIEQTLAMRRSDVEPEMARVEEERGHFKLIEEVVYDGAGPRFVLPGEDVVVEEDEADLVGEIREVVAIVPAVPSIMPSIEEDADVVPETRKTTKPGFLQRIFRRRDR
jgi:penicillin-binding protein 2